MKINGLKIGSILPFRTLSDEGCKVAVPPSKFQFTRFFSVKELAKLDVHLAVGNCCL